MAGLTVGTGSGSGLIIGSTSIGTATGTSLALGGAILGSNALAVTGTASISSSLAINGFYTDGVSVGTTNALGYLFLGTSALTRIRIDAPYTLALGYDTNPNILRVYATSSAVNANFARGVIDTTTANTLTIGTETLGTGVGTFGKIKFISEGATVFDYGVTATGLISCPGQFNVNPGNGTLISNQATAIIARSGSTISLLSAPYWQRLDVYANSVIEFSVVPGACALATHTFATLPASPVAGQYAYITDGSVNTWGSTVAGSGANKVLVWYNGTNWTVAGK